jgi:hypothetical protein
MAVQTADVRCCGRADTLCIVDRVALVRAAQRRVEDAENRTARAHARAAEALEFARRDVAGGKHQAALRHRVEAELHQRAAARQEQAAAIQREHVAHIGSA